MKNLINRIIASHGVELDLAYTLCDVSGSDLKIVGKYYNETAGDLAIHGNTLNAIERRIHSASVLVRPEDNNHVFNYEDVDYWTDGKLALNLRCIAGQLLRYLVDQMRLTLNRNLFFELIEKYKKGEAPQHVPENQMIRVLFDTPHKLRPVEEVLLSTALQDAIEAMKKKKPSADPLSLTPINQALCVPSLVQGRRYRNPRGAVLTYVAGARFIDGSGRSHFLPPSLQVNLKEVA